MSSPFFSVVVPTYNRAGFIHKTIQSVLAQQFENFEVLIVDDGSTDNTQEIVQAIRDNRVHYFKKENAERAAARNFGISKSKGIYITFLDSDDLFLPNNLSSAYNFIQAHKPEVFHLGYMLVDAHTGKERLPERAHNINEQILKGNLLSCIGVFIRKEMALQNLFNETRSLSELEDWELWIRLAARFRFMHSAEVTSLVVNHDSRSVMSVDIEKIKTKVQVFETLVKSDPVNQRVFGSRLKQTYASISTYAALHLAIAKAPRKEIFNYLWRGIRLNPAEVFKKRFLVIVKFAIGL
jgi:glycosyltransferase involved in cell wall biosynthesis